MNQWLYNGKEILDEQIYGYRAFVYKITNLLDGRSYFGKKRFHFTNHKRKKYRKTRIKTVKESDWKNYYGSSNELQLDVQRLGEHNFKREILMLCYSLSESNYYELKFQVENDVLYHPEKFYNAYIGGRISRKQLGVKEINKQ